MLLIPSRRASFDQPEAICDNNTCTLQFQSDDTQHCCGYTRNNILLLYLGVDSYLGIQDCIENTFDQWLDVWLSTVKGIESYLFSCADVPMYQHWRIWVYLSHDPIRNNHITTTPHNKSVCISHMQHIFFPNVMVTNFIIFHFIFHHVVFIWSPAGPVW